MNTVFAICRLDVESDLSMSCSVAFDGSQSFLVGLCIAINNGKSQKAQQLK